MEDRQWTRKLIVSVAVACFGSLQYGYHMSELNGPSSVLSCQGDIPVPGIEYGETFFGKIGASQCIPMDDQGLGLVTAIFSIGGLASSYYAGHLADKYGRKTTLLFNGAIFVFGSLIETFANTSTILAIGRFFSGFGAGCAIVVTPLIINEMSPHGLKGFLGSMNQVAINIGILTTQILAVSWANSIQWRYLLLVGALLGALNSLFVYFFIEESPKWLAVNGDLVQAREVIFKLRGDFSLVDQEIRSYGSETQESLLESGSIEEAAKPVVSLSNYVSDPLYRKSFIVVTAVLAGQQLCGINSIVFYGVGTIRKILPNWAVLINCGISFGNALITFLAAPLVDSHGRKPCLLGSVTVMGISSVLMAIGILQSIPVATVLATFTYVASFAMGLGPIPFLLIPEVTQSEARGAAQSYGTCVNWITTFLIGYLFPIADSLIGGYVYLCFAAICASFVVFVKTGLPETKGKKTYEEVWALRVD
uniref:MFS transporter n=1 Tax=Cyberlindnera americana TaxID=36016 RepID=A0A5P8N9G4_9ASCO|nr:MFS transporter [Cyberlindnera americana]